jgi:hypothetical protein
MKKARGIESNSSTEKILQCYMNGRASCKGCDLSEECKKFRKFVKDNSQYRPPETHTARMMRGI